jgi:hypothetical protein
MRGLRSVTHSSLITLMRLGIGEGGDVAFLLEVGLHYSPKVFNQIQIRRVSQSVHDSKALLPQKGHDFLACMARCPILKKVSSMVVMHPEEQLVLEHVNVPVPIHDGLWGQEVQYRTRKKSNR